MLPPSWAPSEISTIARGGACAPSPRLRLPDSDGERDGVADRRSLAGLERVERGLTSARSCVGGTPTAARVANETTPTRNFSGTWTRNAFAATRAASSLVGSTSFAFIDRDTSIASTIVASSRGTLTVACGRATPTIMNTSATSRSAVGGIASVRGCGRRRSEAGRDCRTPPAKRRAADPVDVERNHHGKDSERREGEGPAEPHERLLRRNVTSGRSQSPDVVSTTCLTPSDASDRASSARSAAAATANRSRSRRLRVSTRSCLPVSGSTRQRSPTSESSCSRGSCTSTATTS